MVFAQVVIGPPGSGKTTYCEGMRQYLEGVGRQVAIINLDPANDALLFGHLHKCAVGHQQSASKVISQANARQTLCLLTAEVGVGTQLADLLVLIEQRDLAGHLEALLKTLELAAEKKLASV